jgi:ABC-type bacteriocin/lantibiotic exporter with double-glycine peptidase domain
MSRAKTLSNRHRIGLCALVMALLAVLVMLWWGLTPLTAVFIAIFVSCLGAALYAWWLSRRVLRPLDDAGRTSTEQNLHNNPRRTQ